jgi:hypothetical protein
MRDYDNVEISHSLALTGEELSTVSGGTPPAGGKPLKLSGIDGESQDQTHQNSIEISSF